MNTDLPEPAKYYRPTRARGLRKQAQRVRIWLNWLLAPTLTFVYFPLVVLLTRACLGDVRAPVLFLVAGVALVIALLIIAYGSVERLREGADRLEAEHAARYGSLPDEVP